MNAKVKEWNDKTAIEKILTVRGTGLREEIYDVALAELAAKDAELAALRQVVEAARKALVAYPKAGKELSDAMIVLYDAYTALARVDGKGEK